MSAVTTLPIRHTYTVDDLDDRPDDGNRYELIDGTLIVTPAPTPPHQRVVARVWAVLDALLPGGFEAFVAPFDVRLSADTLVQPDVLVVRQDVLTDRGAHEAPVLAVEVLSPSTRLVDLNLKRARYEVAACPAYWVVDPGLRGAPPSITAWTLRDGRYVEAAHAVGDETAELELPTEPTASVVRIVPAELARPR